MLNMFRYCNNYHKNVDIKTFKMPTNKIKESNDSEHINYWNNTNTYIYISDRKLYYLKKIKW